MKVVEMQKKVFISSISTEDREQRIKKMRKEDDKMVKGMFEFTEAQGGTFDFSYRFYPGEPIKTITLTHGEIVDLPLGVVKHINNTKKKVKKMDNVDISNGKIPSTYSMESRIRFIPMEYQ